MIRVGSPQSALLAVGRTDSCPTADRQLPTRQDMVILDARNAEAYAAGHLPGAIHADLETQLSSASTNADPARGGRHPLPPIERWLRQLVEWGIDPSTRVVVYDDANGANAAARVWWMLRAVGHENVEVLTQWKDFAAERAPFQPPSLRRPTLHGEGWQFPTVSMQQVDQLRLDPSWCVLDVRAAERFRGETEPIDPVAGHIPGAINLPYAENLDADGQFKSPQEIRRIYEALLGDIPPDRLVVHCGSGVTACHTLLALDMAGLHGASLYVGSWGEWCRNDMPRG